MTDLDELEEAARALARTSDYLSDQKLSAGILALIERVKRAEAVIAEALEEVQSYGNDPEPEDGWRIVKYTSAILATYQNGADQ